MPSHVVSAADCTHTYYTVATGTGRPQAITTNLLLFCTAVTRFNFLDNLNFICHWQCYVCHWRYRTTGRQCQALALAEESCAALCTHWQHCQCQWHTGIMMLPVPVLLWHRDPSESNLKAPLPQAGNARPIRPVIQISSLNCVVILVK